MRESSYDQYQRPLAESFHPHDGEVNSAYITSSAEKHPRSFPWRQVICWFGIAAGLTVLALGITILVLALTFSVTSPVVTVSSISFHNVRLNSTGSVADLSHFAIYVSSVVKVVVAVKNPNRFTLNVKEEDVVMSYSGNSFAWAENVTLPPIGPYQTQEASYPFNFTNVPIFQFNSTSMDNYTSALKSDVLGAVSKAFKSTVLFELMVTAAGNAVHLGIQSPNYMLKVKCSVGVNPGDNDILSPACTPLGGSGSGGKH